MFCNYPQCIVFHGRIPPSVASLYDAAPEPYITRDPLSLSEPGELMWETKHPPPTPASPQKKPTIPHSAHFRLTGMPLAVVNRDLQNAEFKARRAEKKIEVSPPFFASKRHPQVVTPQQCLCAAKGIAYPLAN